MSHAHAHIRYSCSAVFLGPQSRIMIHDLLYISRQLLGGWTRRLRKFTAQQVSRVLTPVTERKIVTGNFNLWLFTALLVVRIVIDPGPQVRV